MSYLHTPRIHFSGGVETDPSTVNNDAGNYDPATPPARVLANYGWNPVGRNDFRFENVKVRSAVGTAGPVAADALINGDVSLFGRLVDIDPEAQTFSQIWGGTVTVTLSAGGGSFTGKLKTCNIPDVWLRGPVMTDMTNFGGTYHSILEQVSFNTASRSRIFDALRTSATANGNTLSIKFNIYAYQWRRGAGFTKAKVTGTIGPALVAEPTRFVPARQLADPGARAFGEAPFLVDTARNKLVIDLGNCIPEDPAGGARRAFGTMRAKIMRAAGPITVGTLDYTEAHYLTTAGVEELPLTAAQRTALASNRLALEVTAPATRLVLTERPLGSYVDVTEMVFRLFTWNMAVMGPPSDNFANLEVFAAEFGRPKSGVTINLTRLTGTPAAALTFPASVTTGANGRASISLTCTNPGSPRGTFLDGAVYKVGLHVGPLSPTNLRAVLIVRVFDEVPVIAAPTWTHVRPIFEQYARLYPSMITAVALDLSATATMRPLLSAYRAAILRDKTAVNYMPVTRDLSPDKVDMIIRWIDNGAPGIP
jgi:hypothetical protein